MTKEEILDKHFPHSTYWGRHEQNGKFVSIKHHDHICKRCDLEESVFNAMDEYADGKLSNVSDQLKTAIAALETLTGISYLSGHPGCTFGDTDYDSMSAAAGFNQAIDNVRDFASKVIKKINNQE